MNPVPVDGLHFRWPWRPYQERLLAAVDRHLQDGRLHIVAAPGAGKTTLGIEVFRRLGRPALVLAPTLTIRDQWIDRLADFEADHHSESNGDSPANDAVEVTGDSPAGVDGARVRVVPPGWTSVDLDAPAFFTASTYQAVLSRHRADERASSLEAAMPRSDGAALPPSDAAALPTSGATSRSLGSASPVDDPTLADDSAPPTDEDILTLVGTLRSAGVGTLILDEAHHLRRAWWSALERVVAELPELTLVSLTGTPPYDATGLQWRRYEQLCGPIDDEISTPELVRARTLCPHQDFVWAVAPDVDEARAVRDFDEVVSETLAALLDDSEFQRAVDGHPWLRESPPIDRVLDDPEVAIALLAYQRASGGGDAPALLLALDLDGSDLPPLDSHWWQVLIREYLYGDTFEENDGHRTDLARILRERGLLWRRSLRIERTPDVERALGLSGAKVTGCVEIHRMERAIRRDTLRQVFLLDYIRDEALDAVGAGTPDLGAWPVFDALTATLDGDHDSGGQDVALLTGRLAVVHVSRVDALRTFLDDGRLTTSAMPGRTDWLRLGGVRSGALVAAFTRLLGEGTLRVIVGTRALLGEGWDAPVVNSVVLASYVGAFVSTNQMRGRAIRRDPALVTKVASVWHLVAVQNDVRSGFLDLGQLEDRFRTFVGLSHDATVIESGLTRLGLPDLRSGSDVEAFNAESRRRLGRLSHVAIGWQTAIARSTSGQVAPTVSFRRPPTLRPLHFARTLRYTLQELAWTSVFALGALARGVSGSVGAGGTAVMVAAAFPMMLLMPHLVRAAKLAFLHAPVDGSIRRIASAILEAMKATGLVESKDALTVKVEGGGDGAVAVSLEGGTFYDQSVFADAVGEVLGPVQNPRYLITRPATGWGGERVDFHAVPSVFGTKRDLAEAFHASWVRHVGVGELHYTRREGGRALLLRARGRAFANQFEDPSQRVDRWQ